VRDADVHDPLYAGALRRPEQGPGVGDGQLVIDPAMGEPDPVRVVKRRHPLERRHQAQLIVEIEEADLQG
jgi:hypothetical protein